jgi:hypothetical protein
MKIVKLNRRHTAFKKWGFPVGIRFDCWDNNAKAADMYLSKTYYTASYQRPDCTWSKVRVQWYGSWGNKSKICKDLIPRRPYWIYLRNEADLTMLMLSGVLDENS